VPAGRRAGLARGGQDYPPCPRLSPHVPDDLAERWGSAAAGAFCPSPSGGTLWRRQSPMGQAVGPIFPPCGDVHNSCKSRKGLDPHHHPGPMAPEAFALHVLPPLLACGLVRVPPQGATVGGSLRELLPQALVRRLHAQPTSPHTRARGTSPQAQLVERRWPLGHARQP
jgi:hypothetical protein